MTNHSMIKRLRDIRTISYTIMLSRTSVDYIATTCFAPRNIVNDNISFRRSNNYILKAIIIYIAGTTDTVTILSRVYSTITNSKAFTVICSLRNLR